MPVLDKKLSKAMKHFERREIKPKEYIEQPAKPQPSKTPRHKLPEPQLLIANKGGYRLKEFFFVPGEDGKVYLGSIIRENINLDSVIDEFGWNPETLKQKIEQARKAKATKDLELQELVLDFVEAGVILEEKAKEFLLDYRLGQLSEMEVEHFTDQCCKKLEKKNKYKAEMVVQRSKDRETEIKEQERLEKYRAEWTPKTRTIAKVYETLKANRNQEKIAELDYQSIMEKTGIGSRSTVAKALAELKDAGKVVVATQYHKSNGYYIWD